MLNFSSATSDLFVSASVADFSASSTSSNTLLRYCQNRQWECIQMHYALRSASESGVCSWAWTKHRQMSTSSVACFRYALPMFLIYLLNANLSKSWVLGGIDGSSRSESMTQGKMNVQTEGKLTRRRQHGEAYKKDILVHSTPSTHMLQWMRHSGTERPPIIVRSIFLDSGSHSDDQGRWACLTSKRVCARSHRSHKVCA